jgi:AraC-like DNA-binding protein
MEGELLATSCVVVGFDRCSTDHPAFGEQAPVSGYRFVFPRQSVWIKPARSRRYVSDPSIVEYYNAGDEFLRQPLDPRGDRTDWYQVREADARDVVRRYDPAAAESRAPFRLTHGPTDDRAYLAQRQLVRRILAAQPVSTLAIEETVLELLDLSLARAYDARPGNRQRPVTRDEREIADRASAVLSRLSNSHATLTTISRTVGVSAFHLSRIFRKVTGRTLARHHLHLRLLASLTPLGESGTSIPDIGVTHGFAGHSHYTAVFHRTFGVTPSGYRSLGAASRRLQPPSPSASRPLRRV